MAGSGNGSSVWNRLGFAGTTSGGSGGFERDLQDAVTERVAIERLDSHKCFIVVGHGDEPEAFALVRLQIANHFDALDSTEGAKELPQDALLRIGRQVVNKNAPACSFIKFEVNICEFQTGFIHCGTLYTVPGMAAPAAAAAAAAAAPGSNGEAKISPAKGENLNANAEREKKNGKHATKKKKTQNYYYTLNVKSIINKLCFVILQKSPI